MGYLVQLEGITTDIFGSKFQDYFLIKSDNEVFVEVYIRTGDNREDKPTKFNILFQAFLGIHRNYDEIKSLKIDHLMVVMVLLDPSM